MHMFGKNWPDLFDKILPLKKSSFLEKLQDLHPVSLIGKKLTE